MKSRLFESLSFLDELFGQKTIFGSKDFGSNKESSEADSSHDLRPLFPSSSGECLLPLLYLTIYR